MKIKSTIQIKAGFLLVIFSLNTIIGFACSMGLNMGFNSSGHHKEETIEPRIHIHSDGKAHIHHKKVASLHDESAKHHHGPSAAHSHEAGNHHHDADITQHKVIKDHPNSKDTKDDCCSDKVVKLNESDKSFSHSLKFAITPIFSTALNSLFFNFDSLFSSQVTTSIKHFVRSYHPPIADIRIAIQSFQV